MIANIVVAYSGSLVNGLVKNGSLVVTATIFYPWCQVMKKAALHVIGLCAAELPHR